MSYPAVLIFDYDHRWPLRFAEEKERIVEALGPRCLAIEHVGSTAVPGLAAKPMIDIMVGVADLAEGEDCIAPLQNVGYFYIHRPRFPECYFFVRGPWRARLFHLHLTDYQGAMWNRLLRFRDYLRTHPDVAREYEEQKRAIAAAERSRFGYSEGKRPFIEEIIVEILRQNAQDG